MKYLIIALIFAGLVVWWFAQRRAAALEARRRREAELPRKAKPTELVRCPRCGVYAVKNGHVCEIPPG
jgi:sterol desaturase/sphingolipid hydroxylase (fatty acid hydroxylase superfamily)